LRPEDEQPVLLPLIQKIVRDERTRLEREQITPWRMMFASGKGIIHNFYGKAISYSGISFEGSPREVFWGRYIEPYLEDFTLRAIEKISNEATESHLDIEVELNCLSNHLGGLYAATFEEMAKADQVMLGRGFPEKFPKKAVSSEISSMISFLDQHVDMEKKKMRSKTNNTAKSDDEFSELHNPDNLNRIANWEKIGTDAIKADLESGGTRYVGTFKNQNLAWKWLKFKESQSKQEKNGTLFEAALLRPNIFGFGVDLKIWWKGATNKKKAIILIVTAVFIIVSTLLSISDIIFKTV
jgi:hypothetical protein